MKQKDKEIKDQKLISKIIRESKELRGKQYF